MARRNWTKDEVRQALSLYLRLDFGKFHSRNPGVIQLAHLIGRTPSAVALKLTNLAALDESLPQKGMANASGTDRAVWAEFLDTPEFVLATYQAQQDAAKSPGFADRAAHFAARQDGAPQSTIAPRVGQAFFREMILTSYGGRCAMTGNEDARLLTASHIVGWAQDRRLRLDPANGICLNALHDRAFDRHLITFDEDYRMMIAVDVPPEARKALEKVDSTRLTLPARFLPSQVFLERHRRAFRGRQAG